MHPFLRVTNELTNQFKSRNGLGVFDDVQCVPCGPDDSGAYTVHISSPLCQDAETHRLNESGQPAEH